MYGTRTHTSEYSQLTALSNPKFHGDSMLLTSARKWGLVAYLLTILLVSQEARVRVPVQADFLPTRNNAGKNVFRWDLNLSPSAW